MKNVIIVADCLEIGGIEKSLINMLSIFDYNRYRVDLRLYRNTGELIDKLDNKVNLLKEKEGCNLFAEPIIKLITVGNKKIFFGRLRAKLKAELVRILRGVKEIGYYQIQNAYIYTHRYLDKEEKSYDVAIGYIGPHNYIISNVDSKIKIGWIHTDYKSIFLNRKLDLDMWFKLDWIISVSEECKRAFLEVYPELKDKVIVIENIIKPKDIIEESLRENRLYDKNYFNLLSIGRICNAKGFDVAVDILEEIIKRGYGDIRWNIVGFGPDEEKIRELIKKKKLEENFIFLGKKVNPYPYIREADLYIQPSRYEGKAVTVTEAKILGKPILISNYETAKSQINHMDDGIIEDLDTRKMANSIIKLYKDKELRERLSRGCKMISYENSGELDKLYKIIESN